MSMVRGRRLRRTGLAVAVGLGLLLPAVALAASGNYIGTTSQGKTCAPHFTSQCRVHVVVANNYVGHKGTGESHISWTAACQAGKNVVYSDVTGFWGPLTHGNLTVHGHYVRSGLGPNGNYTAHNTVTISLHVGQKATGTMTDSSVIEKGSTVVNHCHTGTVSFSAVK